MLLGDPSLRPYGAGLEAPRTRGVTRGFSAMLAAPAPMPPADHRARRAALEQAGDEIARTKPFAERVKGVTKKSGTRGGGKTLVFRVVHPAGPTRKSRGARSAAAPAGFNEQIEVRFIGAEPAPKAKTRGRLTRGAKAPAASRQRPSIPYTRAEITRTRDGEVVSFKRIASR
jgi:hypothetical protein